MPDDQGHETDEEALERLRQVSSTQLFGDNVTSAAISEAAEAEFAKAQKDTEDEEVEEEPDDTGVDFNDLDDDDEEDNKEEELTAAQTVERIEAASSVEEVDALAVDDDRVTVVRSAHKKREELSKGTWG